MGVFVGMNICCKPDINSKKKIIVIDNNIILKDNNENVPVIENLNENLKIKTSNIDPKIIQIQSLESTGSNQKSKEKTKTSSEAVVITTTKDEQNIINTSPNLNTTQQESNSPSPNNNLNNIHINNNDINVNEQQKKNGSSLSIHNLNLYVNNNNSNIEAGSKLLLSGELFFYKEIILTVHGIKESLRKKTDDIVFFGLKKCLDYKGNSYNDFIVNYKSKNDEMGSDVLGSNTGRIFKIYYNKKTKEYMLYFMHNSMILYYKINNFVYFDSGKDYYLILGNIFLTIYVERISPNEKQINIQVELEKEKPKKYIFSQNQTPINIGRVNCDVLIPKSSVSKRHSIIDFSENSNTFYYKDLGSINGSTLIVKEDDYLKLKGEMNFKLEDVPFKILEVP